MGGIGTMPGCPFTRTVVTGSGLASVIVFSTEHPACRHASDAQVVIAINRSSMGGPYAIVGMTNAFSSPTPAPSGQRCVTVLVLVQKRTPSMPCWLMSPKPDRFQPPKLW